MVFSEWSGFISKPATDSSMGIKLRRILAIGQGFFFAILMSACGSGSDRNLDSPTAGEITIAVDESFQPLMQAEVEAFMANYKYATINPVYRTEGEAVRMLLADSARLIVMTRKLTESERAYFREKKITPKELKIATDAVALIVNVNNPDSLLTMEQVARILKGSHNQWSGVSAGNKSGNIAIVLDNSNSSNLSYIKSKFSLPDSINQRIFAVRSNQQVIDYVEKNVRALGVIGVNWISDTEDDPKQLEFINRVRVVAVADTANPSKDDFYQPYQAYLSLKKYPLDRDLYIVSREARTGLGTGFTAFVAGDKGQTVVLKAGLLPATMPVRLVELTK